VLPDGLTSLGRAAGSGVVLDDPQASRVHAMIEVDGEIRLTDLGSANGTFVGGTRIAPGEAHALALGEAFLIGDSALVVRTTSLPRPRSSRTSTWEALQRHLTETAGDNPDQRTLIVGVKPERPTRPMVLEAVLGGFVQGARDWFLPRADGGLLLGLDPSQAESPLELERAVRHELASWTIAAAVESRVVSGDQIERLGEIAGELFAGTDCLALRRGSIILRDPAMKALERAISRVAAPRVNVLILGETGVGKDVVASMLHELSPRAKEPFFSVNCASLPEALLESELFGYERGAFTGAVGSKQGLLEAAHRGTVFLDEIADLPLALQAKLLRVVESQEVLRLGSLKPRQVDIRFLAATNRDLWNEVSSGRFREDLYHRLTCIELRVPPLRERPSEIEPLAMLFLESARERFGIPVQGLSWDALVALKAHPFPGNIRELKNVVERAALLAAGSVIESSHLGLSAPGMPNLTFRGAPAARPPGQGEGPPDSERERIAFALNACGGNQSRAAGSLGISRRTLVRKIAQLGLPRPRSRSN
jgi:DNA-binding NtrC family response regulator